MSLKRSFFLSQVLLLLANRRLLLLRKRRFELDSDISYMVKWIKFISILVYFLYFSSPRRRRFQDLMSSIRQLLTVTCLSDKGLGWMTSFCSHLMYFRGKCFDTQQMKFCNYYEGLSCTKP